MDDSGPGSDIRIDAEGAWFYRGVEMTRRDIIALFYKNLHRDASGRYFIEMQNQRFPVDVEDTAYTVWCLHWHKRGGEAEDSAYILLSDGTTEKLKPESLRIGNNHIPYCSVKGGRFEARFSRASYYCLADHLEFDASTGAYYIPLNARRYCLFRDHP